MLTGYACQHGMNVGGVYIDNGASGLSLDRDALTRLLADIRAASVKTVLVRDLCRLSRDIGDMTRLTEKLFPKYGVRLIAVRDGYGQGAGGNSSHPWLDCETAKLTAGLRRTKKPQI